jgi:hypothetical protein
MRPLNAVIMVRSVNIPRIWRRGQNTGTANDSQSQQGQLDSHLGEE